MKKSATWISVLPSLVIPLCAGLTMYLGLCALLDREVITNETTIRYVAGHPVSKLTTAMFFIGVASLGMIALNLITQFRWSDGIRLDQSDLNPGEENPGEENNSQPISDSDAETAANPVSITADATDAGEFATGLMNSPQPVREHYLWRRLHDALHYIHRTGSSAGIEDELKYLGDMDSERQHQRYSLIRILIWATPMLGFLGTVLGISQALGGIGVGPDNDFQQMLGSLRGSLYVAFDTTALALVLSMVLMFGQFFIERFESQLLRTVDFESRRELAKFFVMSSTGDEVLDSVQRLGRTVLESNHELIRTQTNMWTQSISAAEKAWMETLTGANERVGQNLTMALDESVENLSSYLGQTIRRADDSLAGRLEQWQVSLSDNARLMQNHQDQLIKQTTEIKGLLDQMGQVEEFQKALTINEDAVDATRKLQKSLDELAVTVRESGVVKKTVVVEGPRRIPIDSHRLPHHEEILFEEITDETQTNLTAENEPDFEPDAAMEAVDDSPGPQIFSFHLTGEVPRHGEEESMASDDDHQPENENVIEDEHSPVISLPFTNHSDSDDSNKVEQSATDIGDSPQAIDKDPVPSEADARDAAEGNDTSDDASQWPRYLQAEIESGLAPSLKFPVQMDPVDDADSTQTESRSGNQAA